MKVFIIYKSHVWCNTSFSTRPDTLSEQHQQRKRKRKSCFFIVSITRKPFFNSPRLSSQSIRMIDTCSKLPSHIPQSSFAFHSTPADYLNERGSWNVFRRLRIPIVTRPILHSLLQFLSKIKTNKRYNWICLIYINDVSKKI